MTSLDRIGTKPLEQLSLSNIMLWCKYEVMSIIQREVMTHVVFSTLPNDFVMVVNKHTFCYKPYASVKSFKEGPTFEY